MNRRHSWWIIFPNTSIGVDYWYEWSCFERFSTSCVIEGNFSGVILLSYSSPSYLHQYRYWFWPLRVLVIHHLGSLRFLWYYSIGYHRSDSFYVRPCDNETKETIFSLVEAIIEIDGKYSGHGSFTHTITVIKRWRFEWNHDPWNHIDLRWDLFSKWNYGGFVLIRIAFGFEYEASVSNEHCTIFRYIAPYLCCVSLRFSVGFLEECVTPSRRCIETGGIKKSRRRGENDVIVLFHHFSETTEPSWGNDQKIFLSRSVLSQLKGEEKKELRTSSTSFIFYTTDDESSKDIDGL